MRSHEKEKAFPSGDAMIAGYYACMYFHLFNAPYAIFLITVLAGLGRVYAHCHWFGDIIAGGIIGVIFGHFYFANPYFYKVAWPLEDVILFRL